MLLPVISMLLSGSVNRTVARTKRNGIFIAVAAVLLLTAYVFALVAAAILLAAIYGATGAALFMAAGALLLAIIVLTVMFVIDRQEQQRAQERRLAMESMAVAAIGIVRAQPLLTAAVAGAFLLSKILGSGKHDD